jgi:putative transposase
MPRRPRLPAGYLAYHVLNRQVGRLPLFENLTEAHSQSWIRIAAYSPMPNHWHLLLWLRQDGELSELLLWITVTHTQRWHESHHATGIGSVYQGRFKSLPVQTDEYFLTVVRYVERNACRARLVRRAEDWHWSSGWPRTQGDPKLAVWLSAWPVERPREWVA